MSLALPPLRALLDYEYIQPKLIFVKIIIKIRLEFRTFR